MLAIVTFDDLFAPDHALRSEARACAEQLTREGRQAEILHLPLNAQGDLRRQAFAWSLIDWEHHAGVVVLQEIAACLESPSLFLARRDATGGFVLHELICDAPPEEE